MKMLLMLSFLLLDDYFLLSQCKEYVTNQYKMPTCVVINGHICTSLFRGSDLSKPITMNITQHFERQNQACFVCIIRHNMGLIYIFLTKMPQSNATCSQFTQAGNIMESLYKVNKPNMKFDDARDCAICSNSSICFHSFWRSKTEQYTEQKDRNVVSVLSKWYHF